PVDLRSVKRALSPIYERLKRQLPITVQRASPGFKAVENVMQSYDYMPASVVDADLSAIKALARGADLPGLRTVSQGLAAGVVKELEDAVQAAVAQAGPEATAARNLGRQATARKHRVGDLLRELRSEPVQVFEQATWSRDAGVERLQRIAQEAPGELPKIGRAYLDNLFDRARREGGFERPAGLWERR